MAEIVLDSSAVIAMLKGEVGGDRLVALLDDPEARIVISSVNLCEVVTKVAGIGLATDGVMNSVRRLLPYCEEFSAQDAIAAGELSRRTRAYGLSLGDRACLALANKRGAEVWTTDQIWSRLGLEIPVRLLRE